LQIQFGFAQVVYHLCKEKKIVVFLLGFVLYLFFVCIAIDGLSIEEQQQQEKREGAKEGGAGEGKKVVCKAFRRREKELGHRGGGAGGKFWPGGCRIGRGRGHKAS